MDWLLLIWIWERLSYGLKRIREDDFCAGGHRHKKVPFRKQISGSGAGVFFRPLAGVEDSAFEGGGSADEALVFFRDELVVGDFVEEVVEFPQVFVGGDPVVAHGAEVEGAGVGSEGFASVVVAEVFVVVGQGQLADGLVDRVAVADDGVVGFRDGAPASVFFEQRDDVFVIELDGLEVEEERGFAVQPESGGGEQGAFDAVGFALAKHAPGRHVGVAVFFEIDREAVEEVLDLAGRRKFPQGGLLAGVEAEHSLRIAAGARIPNEKGFQRG